MTFNPENQYRCTIIRGRAITSMDNLLPRYAEVLNEICPCPIKEFAVRFDGLLRNILQGTSKKTLANHRTEIAGKLFGMYYADTEGLIQVSERTKKFLLESYPPDQPAFFKDMCYKMQFPNGMDKIRKINLDINNGIKIKQCAYILRLLMIAEKERIILSEGEIGYYVLNSKEVLQGQVKPELVLEVIKKRRKEGICKRTPSGSRGNQHIRETLIYLVLANLIRFKEDGQIVINSSEQIAVKYIADALQQPFFDMFDFELKTTEGSKRMFLEWQRYYSEVSPESAEVFHTGIEALSPVPGNLRSGVPGDLMALGDEGELVVFNSEKERVKQYNPRFANRVLLLGKTKGLGFDVQSVRARKGPNPEHSIYIEVKSTKRVTAPDKDSSDWTDTITLTRNEWLAAEQHREAYYIYRIYFTSEGITAFIINNPATKDEMGELNAEPLAYRVDFKRHSGEFEKYK